MAYTVLDSRNIDKKKNIYTFGGSGTKPERDDIAENSKLIDYSSGEKFYYDPTKAAGSKWQPDKEPSGGGSGGSLPANFPTEGAANANKYIGFDENGDYTAKEGGSGGGQFVVTLTATEEGGETTYSADKTIAEIVAAHAAGKTVILRYVLTGEGTTFNIDMQCDYAQTVEPEPGISVNVVKFSGSGIEENGKAPTYYVTGLNVGQGDDSFNVTETIFARKIDIPTPLIVNMTLDTSGETPVLVGDKTFGEILTAKSSGKHVMLKLDDTEGSGTLYCMDVITAMYDDSEGLYSVSFAMPNEAIASSQNASDYFSYELS